MRSMISEYDVNNTKCGGQAVRPTELLAYERARKGLRQRAWDFNHFSRDGIFLVAQGSRVDYSFLLLSY